MAEKKTTEQFKKEVKELYNEEYSVLGEYVNSKAKILMKHNTCGNEYEVQSGSFLQGRRCPECYGSNKKTTKQFKDEVFSLIGSEYEVLSEYVNSHTKILMKHNECNNVYETTPANFLGGSRCSHCYGNKKKTTNEFKNEVFDLTKDEYEVVGEYKNANTKILMKHTVCDNEYLVTPSSFIMGTRCPHCFGNFKKTTEIFKKEIFNLVGNEYDVLEDYINDRTKILLKHNICGHENKVAPNSFLRGHRCSYCYGNKKKDTNQFKQELYNIVGDEYELLGKYKSARTKIMIKHCKCNNIYEVTPDNFLRDKRCPYCAGYMKKTQEQYVAEVYNLVGDEYEVLGNYTTSDDKILMKHNNCGHEYNIVAANFLRGRRCPKCSNSKGYSNAEKELLDYIASILPNTEILSNVRNIISPKELDIYIPSLNIAFEYNGLYWHTEEYIDKNYHLDKTNECNKKGIKLIHIFEDEWLNNQKLMKNKIANILGVNNNNRVYARKCYVKEIEDNQIKNNFLNENHIQGKDNSKFSYGLYTKDEDSLVAILTLCKPRVNMGMKSKEDGLCELSRYATNCNVVGSMGKILKYIKINNNDVNKIYTYADLRFTDKEDNVYLKNGFKFVSQSRPNYWYFVSGERKGRFNYQKGNLKKLFPDVYDDDLSEKEIMEIMGYYRIYDCGNLKYEIDMK